MLVFITALSLIINALLFGSTTSQTSTIVSATLKDATYGVDSGVEYGLEKLRANGGFCPAVSGPLKVLDGTTTAGSKTVGSATATFEGADVGLPITGGSIPLGATIVSVGSGSVQISAAAGATATGVALTVTRPARMLLPDGFMKGQPLTVTCGGAEADYTPQSLTSWAVVTLDPGNESLQTLSGAGIDKQISGPTYVSGKFRLQAPLRANEAAPAPGDPGYPIGDGNGFVFQSNGAAGGCNRPSATDLITTNFACTSMPPPDPKPPLPPAPSLAPIPLTGTAGCRIFRPGRYNTTSRPFDLAAKNYLASGVYYLENLGVVDMETNQVFGGAVNTAAGEAQALSAAPCATDAEDGLADDGDTGVQIILGGNTKLDVDRADAEFMAWNPAIGNNQAGAGVSIRTVTSPVPSGYQLWDAGGTGPKEVGLKVEGGTNPHFGVHGLVYMPNASINLFATNTSQAAVLGGVLGWDILLQSSAVGAGLLVQVVGARPLSRSNVIIEATVPVSASKTVTARAVADVNVSRTVTDGTTTSGSNVIGSATAKFSKADEGVPITGTGIPAGASIDSFVSATSVEISAPATSSGTGRTFNIDPPLTRAITNAATTSGSEIVSSSTAPFSGADVGGTITGGSIPANSKILRFINPNQVEISNTTISDNSMTLTITRRKIVRVAVNSWRVDNP